MQRHSLSSKARHPAILGIAFLLCGCVALGVPRVARAREVEGLVAYLPFDEEPARPAPTRAARVTRASYWTTWRGARASTGAG